MMKTDIQNRPDIERLVEVLIGKIKSDEMIGSFFSGMQTAEEQELLQTMCNFWENIVFYTGHYDGNPMAVHQRLHGQRPLSCDHFRHWVKLFSETVDELFEGSNAGLVKQRANGIATVMEVKILKAAGNDFTVDSTLP